MQLPYKCDCDKAEKRTLNLKFITPILLLYSQIFVCLDQVQETHFSEKKYVKNCKNLSEFLLRILHQTGNL